uniref:Uncharacterized protein n=1 Tax=Physcomitrium patens TaxID=3218 RepID=A0A7I3YUM8_PHYPA
MLSNPRSIISVLFFEEPCVFACRTYQKNVYAQLTLCKRLIINGRGLVRLNECMIFESVYLLSRLRGIIGYLIPLEILSS